MDRHWIACTYSHRCERLSTVHLGDAHDDGDVHCHPLLENVHGAARMKVALYARVSKDEAASDGSFQEPENQLAPLRRYCTAMEWSIFQEYVDRCSGGDSNRPQFQKMLVDAEKKEFDMIVIWSLDRFSREGISNTLGYIKKLRHNKCNLKSLQESWLDTSQEGVAELLLSIMSWVAAEERKKISERTKAALARKKANGMVLGRPRKTPIISSS